MIFGSKRSLKYNDKGLIPAIVQDADSKNVLMHVYMNRESLRKCRKTGDLWLYHRKEKRVWKKGSKSGRTMRIVDIITHHDRNILLVQVIANGPACHTGNDTCFYGSYLNEESQEAEAIEVENLAEDGLEKIRSLFDKEDPGTKPVLEDSAPTESSVQEHVIPGHVISSTGNPVNEFQERDGFVGLLERIRTALSTMEGTGLNYGFVDMAPEKIAQRIGEEAMQLISSVSMSERNKMVDSSARIAHYILVLLAKNEIGPNLFESRWNEETARWKTND